MVRTLFNTVSDKKIAIWGFAFKKDTNDTRESAAIYVCRDLLLEKARLSIYDPQVSEAQLREDLREVMLDADGNLSRPKHALLEENVEVVESCEQAADAAHAIAVLTEWDEFRDADFAAIRKRMKQPATLFDGRNLLKHAGLEKQGFAYHGIGF